MEDGLAHVLAWSVAMAESIKFKFLHPVKTVKLFGIQVSKIAKLFGLLVTVKVLVATFCSKVIYLYVI